MDLTLFYFYDEINYILKFLLATYRLREVQSTHSVHKIRVIHKGMKKWLTRLRISENHCGDSSLKTKTFCMEQGKKVNNKND